jgi:hypothetical protein
LIFHSYVRLPEGTQEMVVLESNVYVVIF